MYKIPLQNFNIEKWISSELMNTNDLLAVETPLEIIIIYKQNKAVKETLFTVTMRSPGNDEALAVGLLFAEGVIQSFQDIEHIRYCIKNKENNTLRVTLKKTVLVNEDTFKRNLISSSSCGVCGKQIIDQQSKLFAKIEIPKNVGISTLIGLPKKLKDHQLLFKHTGGIHACALFTSGGSLITIKEDIGRHNALDKIIGHHIINGSGFNNTIVVLSGRVGFEMAQKSARAGIPMILAIGAPTSLAVQIAKEAKICLLGFAKKDSINCYSYPEYVNFLE